MNRACFLDAPVRVVSCELLSMGHPLGVSGVRVVNDIARQLWGEAGVNQVEGARVGLAQMLGGILTRIESPVVAGIHILVK